MIRVLLYGLGPDRRDGRHASSPRATASASSAPSTSIRQRSGRDVGDIAGLDAAAPREGRPRRAQGHQAERSPMSRCCARRLPPRGLPQIEDVLKAKMPIVTTTEELSYPVQAQRRAGEEDRRDGEEGQGRGAFARASTQVRDGRAADHADRGVRARRSVTVNRVQDARTRRLPFQQKIGAGLSPRAVRARGRARDRSGTSGSPNRSR